jgi:hypothetical protein
VQVVGASADPFEDQRKVLQFVRETKVNFPVWLGATTADMMRFGLGAALPGTVIIGRDGRVVRAISGIVNQADLKKQIERMLAAAATAAEREQSARAQERPAQASAVPS